jgi:hypothetical protein
MTNETLNAKIKATTAALRKNAIELDEPKISYARLVRLSDKRWDLEAQYTKLLREAGLSRP